MLTSGSQILFRRLSERHFFGENVMRTIQRFLILFVALLPVTACAQFDKWRLDGARRVIIKTTISFTSDKPGSKTVKATLQPIKLYFEEPKSAEEIGTRADFIGRSISICASSFLNENEEYADIISGNDELAVYTLKLVGEVCSYILYPGDVPPQGIGPKGIGMK